MKKSTINLMIMAVMGIISFVTLADEDPVVGLVNGTKIFQSDIIRARALLPKQYSQGPMEMIFPSLLNSLIDSHLAAEYARETNLHKSNEFKTDMIRIERQVLQRVLLRTTIANGVTEKTIRDRFEKFKQGMSGKEEVRARHILLKTESEAKRVIHELDKGADFIKIAKNNSTGPSANSGGDLGYFGRGQMVPAFEKAAFELEEGVYTSVPIKTQFGWHVIYVEDRRNLAQQSFQEAREMIQHQLSQKVVSALMGRLRKKAKVEMFSFDGNITREEE